MFPNAHSSCLRCMVSLRLMSEQAALGRSSESVVSIWTASALRIARFQGVGLLSGRPAAEGGVHRVNPQVTSAFYGRGIDR